MCSLESNQPSNMTSCTRKAGKLGPGDTCQPEFLYFQILLYIYTYICTDLGSSHDLDTKKANTITLQLEVGMSDGDSASLKETGQRLVCLPAAVSCAGPQAASVMSHLFKWHFSFFQFNFITTFGWDTMSVVFHCAVPRKDTSANCQKESLLVFMESEMDFLIKFL